MEKYFKCEFFYETKTLPQKTSVGFICIHFSQLKRIYTGIRCFYLIFIGTVKKRAQTKCETKEKFILFSELFFASTKWFCGAFCFVFFFILSLISFHILSVPLPKMILKALAQHRQIQCAFNSRHTLYIQMHCSHCINCNIMCSSVQLARINIARPTNICYALFYSHCVYISYYILVACFVCLHSFHGVIWCKTLVQFESMKFLTLNNVLCNMISK